MGCEPDSFILYASLFSVLYSRGGTESDNFMDDNTHSVVHCTRVKGSEVYYRLVLCPVLQVKEVEYFLVQAMKIYAMQCRQV